MQFTLHTSCLLKKSKLINILLLTSNTFFLLLYITICINNRLAADDFHFLSNIKQFGLLNGTFIEYNSWSTRYASVFLNHLVLTLIQFNKHTLFFFGLFNLIIFTLAIKLLIKNTIKYLDKNHHFNQWFQINISIYIVSIIFISTFKINETWFWLCASCTYLWSVIMLVFGSAWIINRESKIWLKFLGCFAFAYIGGSCEPLALMVLLLLMLIIFLTRFDILPINIPKQYIITRCVLAALFCLTAFIILYMGQGNRNRETFFHETNVWIALLSNIKMTGIIVLKKLPSIIPFTIILSLPSVYLGSVFKKIAIDMNWKRKMVWLTIFYLSAIYLYQLPITYKTQDIGAYRALFPISIFTILYFSILFFIIGQNIRIGNKLLKGILFFSTISLCFINAYNLANQTKIVFAYSKTYDERIAILKQPNNNHSTIELNPLPASGMIYSAEISKDTSYFSNQHLKNGLELKFQVRLK